MNTAQGRIVSDGVCPSPGGSGTPPGEGQTSGVNSIPNQNMHYCCHLVNRNEETRMILSVSELLGTERRN